jgi:hypothetical protein
LHSLREAGRVRLATTEGTVELADGCLDTSSVPADPPPEDAGLALAPGRLGERQAVAGWLERAVDVRIVDTERPIAYPWPRAEPLEQIELPDQTDGSG